MVTDVGDARFIVGEAGVVVPPGDPDALAVALVQTADTSKAPAQSGGRERVSEHFSVERSDNEAA